MLSTSPSPTSEAATTRKRELSGPVRGRVGLELRLALVRREHRGDAEPVRFPLRFLEARGQLRLGSLGEHFVHQVHRALAQCSARLAGARIPLDPSVRRIGRIAGDAGQCQRARVDPERMAVHRLERGRTVRHGLVEQGLGGVRRREQRELPSATADPRQVGPGTGTGTDRIEDGRHAHQLGDGALAELRAADRWVHVRILEAGEHHPSLQLDDLRAWADEARRNAVAADVDDPAVAHGDRRGPASGRVHRVHGAAAEHEVGRPGGFAGAGEKDRRGQREQWFRSQMHLLIACHPERSEGGMTRRMSPSLRSG